MQRSYHSVEYEVTGLRRTISPAPSFTSPARVFRKASPEIEPVPSRAKGSYSDWTKIAVRGWSFCVVHAGRRRRSARVTSILIQKVWQPSPITARRTLGTHANGPRTTALKVVTLQGLKPWDA